MLLYSNKRKGKSLNKKKSLAGKPKNKGPHIDSRKKPKPDGY